MTLFDARLGATLILCALIVAGCARDPEERRQRHFDAANRHVEQKAYQEAVIEYRKALQAAPRFGEGHYRLAEAYAAAGEATKALREFVVAADLLPARVDVQLAAGNALLLAGDFDRAKQRAERALATDARNIDAFLLLGNALAGLKDFDRAISEVEAGIALEPDDGRAYAQLGFIQLARGREREAETAFQ